MDIKRFDIIDGPDIGMICDAMKYVFNDKVVIPIKFDIISWHPTSPTTDGCAKTLLDTRKTKIEGIKHIGRTGHRLKLIGRLEARFSVSFSPYQFAAVYDTVTHKGSIEISCMPD